MVDAADPEKIEASKNELHNLLDKPQLQGIPVRAPGHHFDFVTVSAKCALTNDNNNHNILFIDSLFIRFIKLHVSI